jgi:acylpyruvate hydrolase
MITKVSAAVVSGALLIQLVRFRQQSRRLWALVLSGRKAVCVGKNYHEHITELAQLGPEWKLDRELEPVLFLKPTSSYARPGEPLMLPRQRLTSNATEKHGVHHEVELAVIIGRKAKDITDDASAMACVAGYALALDITQRDEQTAAKNKGMARRCRLLRQHSRRLCTCTPVAATRALSHLSVILCAQPWSVSKSYDSFLPLSEPFVLPPGADWRALHMWLCVNGERRQACDAGVMIHSVPALIRFVSQVMTLEPGDLLVTGTPKGVGPLVAGDRVTAGIDGYATMEVEVVQQQALESSSSTAFWWDMFDAFKRELWI